MQTTPKPPAISAATEELLQSLPAAACLVSASDHRIVLYNQTARDLIGDTLTTPHLTCHALLCQNDSWCKNCPDQLSSADTIPELRSASVQTADGNTSFIKYQCSSWQGYHLLLFFNISREIKSLHATDLARKELQAKLVMQDHRQQEVLATLSHLELMIDHIPEAVLAVDESFFIIKKNKAVDVLPTSTGVQRCYDLVGRTTPCEDCPAREGFHAVTEHIKSHTVDGTYLTETISKSPRNDGGLLLFRDTTRQLKLVAQIKEQQDNITRQNEILSSLASFGTYIQQETQLSDVVDFFMNLFLPLIKTDTGIIIVNDIRPGNILCHVQQGIHEEELAVLMRAYLSRDMQSNRIETIPESSLPWPDTRQIPLLGTDGRRVGLLVLRDVDSQHDDNINLFAEPLGACIHNRLLTLKLEEKANTDPLTGIYNRGYFHRALEMEEEKFKNLHIHYAVVEADINRLKFANDQYGHEAGDLLIITASNLLSQSVRMGDVVARTGGDEFLILLTNTGSEGAAAFIQRLKENLIQGTMVTLDDNKKFPLEISLGYAGTDEFPPEEIIKEADHRMYQEKEAYYHHYADRRRPQATAAESDKN